MPALPITFIKGDSIGSETDYRDSLPENMYAIIKPVLGADGYMTQFQGLKEYGTGAGIDRGGVWNDRQLAHYRVSAGKFIVVFDNGSNTRFGDIPGLDNVSLPYSFNTQAVIGGGNFYLYDDDNGFRQVTDPDVGNPIDGVWIDGYYFLTDGEFIYHTDINDEESIDPIKFATAEFLPDETKGLGVTQDDKVMVFGRYSTEYFVNQATENFAFQRIQSRALKIGIVATHAKAELNQIWYILGGRKEGALSVHAIGVGSSPPVSTREVDKVIGQYTEDQLQDVVLEARTQDGYSFITVHLPNETLLYNETMAKKVGIEQAWTIIKTGKGSGFWRGIHGIFEPRLGEWVYGDREDLRLGILDDTITEHYGELSEWVLYTPFIYAESMSIDEFNVEIMPGHTTSDDATAFLSLTYDGVTYGTEVTMEYGEPSNYLKRFIKYRLGYVRDWVGIKIRGVSRSRMGFSRGYINIG